MSLEEKLKGAREKLRLLSLYQQFEHLVVMFLTALIVVIVIAAVWSLSLKIVFGLVLSGSLDPSDYSVFQAVFGMIFTVIIALEFKKDSLGRNDRSSGHLSESHYSGSERNRCAAYTGTSSRDPCAWSSLLADAR
jgi:hypothetical protein